MKFAFLDKPKFLTEHRIEFAKENDIEIQVIEGINPYYVVPDDISEHGDFDGVITTNVSMAMRLCKNYIIARFHNNGIKFFMYDIREEGFTGRYLVKRGYNG